jgi:predicted nucleic acid-binding protein
MAEIVNLRRARKQRARSEAEAQAEQNRLIHGRSKSEKRATEAERLKAAQQLDGHRLPDDDGRPKR